MKIDLNCDMGEGCGNDAALMDYVSSVNIACGFHAGDAATMLRTVKNAIAKGVAIGAHPGYDDRENFGRVAMSLSPDEVHDIVLEQITSLREICDAVGGKLRHVKPHGALYNQAVKDVSLANAIAMAVKAVDENLILFGLSGSIMMEEGEKCGLRTASEVFADRTYRSDGSLTPRSEANALIKDTDTAVAQVLQMVREQTVTSTDGHSMPITADTICIHGDGENALTFAKTISEKLKANNIEISPV
ncbi:MAG: 5-oxoprolinase subunit PxpA [Acidobacteriota bacterium]